jgi:hypothetical protein
MQAKARYWAESKEQNRELSGSSHGRGSPVVCGGLRRMSQRQRKQAERGVEGGEIAHVR